MIARVFLLSILLWGGLAYRGVRRSLGSIRSTSLKVATTPSNLESLAAELVVAGNSTATLLNLISFGDRWSSNRRQGDGIGFGVDLQLPATWERVPGCMADARLLATCCSPNQSGAEPHVTIDGAADSRVAHGMLALLCAGLSDSTASSVLSLRPSTIAKDLGLQSLPPGRLDGLKNMLTVIQRQTQAGVELSLRRELLHDSTSTSSSSSTSTRTLTSTNSSILVAPALSAFSGPDPRAEEVAVLLSGGVDSSVALQLLQAQGYRVRAFYLKIWLEDEVRILLYVPLRSLLGGHVISSTRRSPALPSSMIRLTSFCYPKFSISHTHLQVAHLNQCPWEEDLTYAQQTCDQLGVPLETLSLQKEYWEQVVQYTFSEARAGRTPNPDVMCNSRVKVCLFV